MRSPVRSMTGFASCRGETSAGELGVTLRSVNHRSLDIHLHATADSAAFENEIRALLKRHIARGHGDVRVSLERRGQQAGLRLNRELLNAYVTAFREAAHDLQLTSTPDLNRMIGLPGVVEQSAVSNSEPGNDFGPELLAALETCARELNAHREREGEALLADIAKQAAEIRRGTHQIAALREQILPEFQNRLREKLNELLSGANLTEARIAEEAALLADRSDIQEELVRLNVHLDELEKRIAEGGEIGKRLDFLLQEMNREANTTLAKSANAGEPGLALTTLGLDIKAKIEKIREQALNLE